MEHGAKREKDDVFSHKFIPALLLFALRPMRFANFHRITLSARAKTLGGTTSILDFGLRILDYHSSDDSICSGEHVRRNHQADLLRGFEIQRQLEFTRLLDWQLGRLGAFENLADIICEAPVAAASVASSDIWAPGCQNRTCVSGQG
jgi:hypothetical protein